MRDAEEWTLLPRCEVEFLAERLYETMERLDPSPDAEPWRSASEEEKNYFIAVVDGFLMDLHNRYGWPTLPETT